MVDWPWTVFNIDYDPFIADVAFQAQKAVPHSPGVCDLMTLAALQPDLKLLRSTQSVLQILQKRFFFNMYKDMTCYVDHMFSRSKKFELRYLEKIYLKK